MTTNKATRTEQPRRNLREIGDRRVRTTTAALVAASLAGVVVLTACDASTTANTSSNGASTGTTSTGTTSTGTTSTGTTATGGTSVSSTTGTTHATTNGS